MKASRSWRFQASCWVSSTFSTALAPSALSLFWDICADARTAKNRKAIGEILRTCGPIMSSELLLLPHKRTAAAFTLTTACVGGTPALLLMRLFCCRGGVGCIYFLCYRARRCGRRLKLSGILSRHRDYHEVHPDWQCSVRSCFFRSQGFLFVVADPDSAGHGRRKSHKPGVGEIVGRASLARDRKGQPGGGDCCAVQNHLPQHRGHDACRALADHIFYVGKIFFQHPAFVVGHARDVARRHPHAVVGKYAIRRR